MFTSGKGRGFLLAAFLIATLAFLGILSAGCGRKQAGENRPAASEEGPPAFTPRKADTSGITRKWLDAAYAEQSEAQKLDIYLPEKGEGPFPVLISVHGGGFMMGDKADDMLEPMLGALGRGYAVASINYRLSSEAKFPAQINDVKAAIGWLREHAAEYKLDPAKIAVSGGSAGGNLAALAGTTGEFAALGDPPTAAEGGEYRVQAVIDLFGPIDFSTMDAQAAKNGTGGQAHSSADSPESQLLGKPIGEVPALVKAANPATYITPDDPPFLIQHGTADDMVPMQQSEDFAAQLRKTLGEDRVTFEKLQGAGHGTAEFGTPENMKKILDWLDAALR